MSPPIIIAPRYLDLVEWFSGVRGITAQTLGFIIVARHMLSPRALRHETIHVYQWFEVSLVGSAVCAPLGLIDPLLLLLALWVWLPGVGLLSLLHFVSWLWLLSRGHSRQIAYKLIPFELEAYTRSRYDLSSRTWFGWIHRY